MKKLLCLALSLVLVLSFGAAALADTYEIAMITDIGTIDDKSFNQGTWEGIKAYCEANGKTFNYYQPSAQSTDMYIEKIDQAVADGAKVIVTPGYLFEEPIFIAQTKYPDIYFLLIDGTPNLAYSEFFTGPKTVGVTYAEHESAYLAGYAAVVDGMTNLGFMGGMAVPAVVNFGYGFVQGAEAAAKELGIDGISINYHYTGGFDATPEAQAMAASWYQGGVECIFACGGAVGNSVMAAAEANNGKVIGVDVDQSSESETVITSALKGLSSTVEQILAEYYADTFPGGQNLVFGAVNKGVALPMATSKFEKFDQAQYDALFEKIAASEIVMQTNADVASAAELALEVTTVNLVQ